MSCELNAPDLVIRRGNNYPPAKWQFLSSENPDVLFPIDGSTFKLTVSWPGTEYTLSSDTDPELVIDEPNSMLTWNYSVTQSRDMPVGQIARYELERWIGGAQQSWIEGSIIVKEGRNLD